MSNLFGLRKPNTDLRKNVFDLSEKTLFSMSAGMLLPVIARELNPGEKLQCSLSALTRTQPLNTAAFARNRQFFHFFFVPYKQLWQGWDNFINGVDYKQSALQHGKDYSRVPGINLLKVISKLIKSGHLLPDLARLKAERAAGGYTGNTAVPRRSSALPSDTPSLGVPSRPNVGNLSATGAGITTTAAPTPPWQEVPIDAKKLDEHGYYYYRGMSRLLDMLGYGFSYFHKNLGKEFNTLSDLLEAIVDGMITVDDFHTIANTTQLQVNPFRLLAYQKIYNDFYKRDDYEATDPRNFNIDDIANSAGIDGLDPMRLIGMLRLRYRWIPKDYFTGVVPSELFGADKALTTSVAFGGSIGTHSIEKDSVKIPTVTTKSIRSAFAIEKHLRLTRRAGGFDYISQTAAHYGFEPPKGRGDKVEFIGGYDNTINISEVITTANTDQGATGQIYGRGVGSMSLDKDFDFQAKEHGVFLCIASIVPEGEYNSNGLHAFNAKFEKGDYFHPEFQDLGLQPVFNYELANYINPAMSDSVENSDLRVLYHSTYSPRDGIVGYGPRYAEYKTAYDTVHGEFRNGKSMSAWSVTNLVRSSRQGVRPNTLRINPKMLDRIFAIEYNGSEATDQFMVNAQFIVKCIRPMSITGQNL